MHFEIVPLKAVERSVENDKRKWLMDTFEECYVKIMDCMDHDNSKVGLQGDYPIIWFVKWLHH